MEKKTSGKLFDDAQVGTGKCESHSETWSAKPEVIPTQDVKSLRKNFTQKLYPSLASEPKSDPRVTQALKAFQGRKTTAESQSAGLTSVGDSPDMKTIRKKSRSGDWDKGK